MHYTYTSNVLDVLTTQEEVCL